MKLNVKKLIGKFIFIYMYCKNMATETKCYLVEVSNGDRNGFERKYLLWFTNVPDGLQ